MNALLERPGPVTATQGEPLLLQFERQGKPLGRIPMVVRLNLDLCGLSFGLDDWVGLDLETKIALASCIADTPEKARLWTRMVLDCIAAARPCDIDPGELPGLYCAQLPARINVQMLALGLAKLDEASWAGLNILQRYALMKLSRPGHRNRDFHKLALEIVLA
jgi:hypothetical protein